MAIPISHPSFGLEVTYLCKASSPQAWGCLQGQPWESRGRCLRAWTQPGPCALTQPLQSHWCRVRPSTLQPPWAMVLLGQGWQEKVGLLQASGSRQGGDQTQGSLEEQGRALSIVLHGAEAAETTEWGVPARLSQLLSPIPAAGLLCGGASHMAQGPPGHIREPAQLLLPSGPLLLAQPAQREAHCPGRTRAVGSHAQSMHRNKKSPRVYSPAQLLLSHYSITLSFAMGQQAGDHKHPPQPQTLLIPLVSPKKPRHGEGGSTAIYRDGGHPIPTPACWQLRNCLYTNKELL